MGLPGLQSPSDTHVLQHFVLRTAQGTPPDYLCAETSPNASAVPSSLKLISGWPPPSPASLGAPVWKNPRLPKESTFVLPTPDVPFLVHFLKSSGLESLPLSQ